MISVFLCSLLVRIMSMSGVLVMFSCMRTNIAPEGVLLRMVSCRDDLEYYVFMFDFCEGYSVIFEARDLLTWIFRGGFGPSCFQVLNYLLTAVGIRDSLL